MRSLPVEKLEAKEAGKFDLTVKVDPVSIIGTERRES